MITGGTLSLSRTNVCWEVPLPKLPYIYFKQVSQDTIWHSPTSFQYPIDLNKARCTINKFTQTLVTTQSTSQFNIKRNCTSEVWLLTHKGNNDPIYDSSDQYPANWYSQPRLHDIVVFQKWDKTMMKGKVTAFGGLCHTRWIEHDFPCAYICLRHDLFVILICLPSATLFALFLRESHSLNSLMQLHHSNFN